MGIAVPESLLPLVRIWRHRNYAWFMGGMAPSLVTSWMQRIGTGWLAWELTHQNVWVGAIVAADYAPMLVLAPFVGAITDRSDPVEQQKMAQWLALLQSLVVAVLAWAGLLTIEMLFVLCLFLGCLHPFNAIARHSIVPATVPIEDLPTALAVDSALFNLSRFIGPALASVIIAFSGVWPTFAVNVVGCACYLAGLYGVRLPPVERHARSDRGIGSEIVEGLRYVRGHAGMGPLFLLMAVSAVLLRPMQDLLPGFAGQVFESGASGLGWLTASMGIGATVSAVLIAAHGRVVGLTLAVMLAFMVNVLATLGFVATRSLWIALVFGVAWGATLTMTSTATQALLQSAVDNALRGRVMALYTMIYRGAPFIGSLLIGTLADGIGLRLAFACAALICIAPWLKALAGRDAITTALEGSSNDLDQQLLSTARSWAGLQYERWIDLRALIGNSPLCARLQALLQRRP
jgi:MFS family permease